MGQFKAILIDAVSSSTSHFYVPRGEFNFPEKYWSFELPFVP